MILCSLEVGYRHFGGIYYPSLNYFSKLLNVRRISDVRQIEIHTAEPLVPEPIPFEVEIAIAKLKKYKSPSSDEIMAELIQTGGEILESEILKLINFILSKEELPDHFISFYLLVHHRSFKNYNSSGCDYRQCV
jgi:hypothetical protein